MKRKIQSSLILIASLAIILPAAAFAEDKDKDQKKQDKKGGNGHQQAAQQGRQSSPSAGRSEGRNSHNNGRVNNASSGQGHVSHVSRESAGVQQSSVNVVSSQSRQSNKHSQGNQRNKTQVSSSQRGYQGGNDSGSVSVRSQSYQPSSRSESRRSSQTQVYSNQKSYNRSNNYGGLWYPENTHNWNRRGTHRYNNHDYRWYEGGWLIIDGGYTPYYSNTIVYSTGASIASRVQSRLSDQGYYRGAIDGDIGPGSRNAIANYQGDYGLRVTGRINDSLLQSLGLE